MTIAPEPQILPDPAPPAAPERARQGWITPLLSVIATIALVVTLGGAVLGGIRLFAGGQTTASVSTAGVDTLDIRASAGSFSLVYAEVDEATLRVTGSANWTLEREGSSIVVRPPHRWFGSWLVGVRERAVLTLPIALRDAGLDALFSLSAGEFRAEGEFGILQLRVSAGEARIDGGAQTADVKVSAGKATVTLTDVSTARFDVSAGEIIAKLDGLAPSDLTVDVSAGSITATVPDAAYAVSQKVSAGSFDWSVRSDPASSHRVTVNVSAGSVELRPAP